MFRSRYLAAVIAVVGASATSVAAGGVADAAPRPPIECYPGEFCITSGPNFTGEFAWMDPDEPGPFCTETPFRAVSVWNRSNRSVAVYHDAQCWRVAAVIDPGEAHGGGDYFNSNSPW